MSEISERMYAARRACATGPAPIEQKARRDACLDHCLEWASAGLDERPCHAAFWRKGGRLRSRSGPRPLGTTCERGLKCDQHARSVGAMPEPALTDARCTSVSSAAGASGLRAETLAPRPTCNCFRQGLVTAVAGRGSEAVTDPGRYGPSSTSSIKAITSGVAGSMMWSPPTSSVRAFGSAPA
jgi:hypothetical protein